VPTVANERLLFIHIPKTAGTWAEGAMRRAGVALERFAPGPHPQLSTMPPRGGRFTFSFVRDPLAWYRSLWSFRQRGATEAWKRIGPAIDLDFPDFLAEMAERKGWLYDFYKLYVEGIDFVGRKEHLADDLVTALRLAGQEFDEDKLRSFPARNFEGEEEQRLMKPPDPDLQIPADLAHRIVVSEYQVYEEFYVKRNFPGLEP
jgi:hypothetical protein